MKKILSLMLLAMVLLLSACGQKPVFGVSTNEDNSISITADRGPKDSMGLAELLIEFRVTQSIISSSRVLFVRFIITLFNLLGFV